MLDPPVVSRAAGRLAYDTLPLVNRLLGIDQGLGAFRKLSYDEGCCRVPMHILTDSPLDRWSRWPPQIKFVTSGPHFGRSYARGGAVRSRI